MVDGEKKDFDYGVETLRKFKEIKEKYLKDEDIIWIEGKKYITKSGWRKIKNFFKLSLHILHSERIEVKKGGKDLVIWKYRVRVSSPDGVDADAEGVCSSDEKFAEGKDEHALASMAQTRAFNRAISDLVGCGETSAEEIIWSEIKPKKEEKREEAIEEKRKEEIEIRKDGVRKEEIKEEIEERAREEEKIEEKNKIDEIKKDEIKEVLENEKYKMGYKERIESAISESLEDKMRKQELLREMQQLMIKVGLKTPDEKKEFAMQVIGREIQSSKDLTLKEVEKIVLALKRKLDIN